MTKRLNVDIGDSFGSETMVVPTPANPAERLAPSGRTTAPGPPALDRHKGDLYIRTSWIDASLALSQLEKVSFNLNGEQIPYQI